MRWTIEKQELTNHRETSFREYVSIRGGHLAFDGIDVFIIKFECDQKWWIVPCTYYDDDKMSDMGPYDEVTDALLILRLCGEN
jgi:hypothetical protein